MALDRNIAPVIKDAIDFDIKLKPYQHFVLDNQVEVYTYEGCLLYTSDAADDIL
jgi:hypothetical protein